MLETEIAMWKPPVDLAASKDELAMLKQVPLFEELRDAELRRVMKLLHAREYAPDEVVFREGQTGAGMYVIKQGEVDIVARKEDGSEVKLVTLRDGQFFGELALLESAPRSAAAVVRKPSSLLGLFQSDLEHLIERDSKLGARVVWSLARLTGSRLRELSNSVRARANAPAAEPR